MFGTRQKEDVLSAGKVMNKLSRLYEKDRVIYPVKFKITLKENQNILLDAFYDTITASVQSDFVVQKAINKPLTADIIESQLKKCGATAFYFDSCEIDSDENISVPLSQLNQLRRDALDELKEKITARKPPVIYPIKRTFLKHIAGENKETYFCFNTVTQIPDNMDKNADIFLPLSTDIKTFERLIKSDYKIGAKIPRGIFGNAEKIKTKLNQLQALNVKKVIAPTLDAIVIAKKFDFEVIAGIGTNCFNTEALNFFESQRIEKVVLSFELTAHQINHLGGKIKRGIVAYGKLPLMLTRNCPVKNGSTCLDCRQNGYLTDRMDNRFSINCRNDCCEILNPFPLYVLDKTDDFKNIDFYLFEFTDENQTNCQKIIESYHEKAKPPEKNFTRGLYFRGVQ
ncbi:hypothetical protein SDC9_90587 [bioreactor metagenome]|uniref:Peptidase U32 collagenase domain-containing protein n=1 Tax=bioreactor metagenome TaxID=1076179 RepID=A0A644ZSD1_9ZZZZ